jgi:dihydroorotase
MTIIEGKTVNIDGIKHSRIEIGDDGLISKISEPIGTADLVLNDELIFPGFIDLHVHARECADHSWDYKEDFQTAGLAAINGGVVAFFDMPNNTTPPVDDKSFSEKLLLTKKSAAEVFLYAGVNSKTSRLDKNVPYKIYISKSVGDLFFDSFADLDLVLEKYRGQFVSFHCEDPNMLRANSEKSTHEQKRPAGAEVSAVHFALQMIEKYNLNGKICHCSTKEAFVEILDAKKRGLKVSVEVTPHHLFFDETMMNHENRKMFQVNPPIRQSEENRLALIAALKKGDIDFLATDHAPHSMEEKLKGMSGLTHLDTYGSFITWLMKEHNFTPQEIARVCSFNPGQFTNNFSFQKYGKVEEGYIGSLSIINPDKPIIISKDKLKTKAGWSPFEGVTFPGSVAYTVVRGKIYNNHPERSEGSLT